MDEDDVVVDDQIEQDEPVEAIDTDEADDTEDSGDDTADAPEAKPLRGVQKRIDELTRRNHESRAENERLSRLLEQQSQPRQEERNDEPQIENYNDYAAYTKDVGRWAAREERLRSDHERSVRSAQDAAERKTQGVVSAGRDKYADFNEVALSDKVRVSDIMAQAMSESEAGPDVAYYLGKNRDEALRISQLSPMAQVLEIGRIESRIGAPSGKRLTGAPAPVTTLGRGGSVSTPDPDKMSMKDWVAHRNKTAKN